MAEKYEVELRVRVPVEMVAEEEVAPRDLLADMARVAERKMEGHWGGIKGPGTSNLTDRREGQAVGRFVKDAASVVHVAIFDTGGKELAALDITGD